jgi:hypothetical protein
MAAVATIAAAFWVSCAVSSAKALTPEARRLAW